MGMRSRSLAYVQKVSQQADGPHSDPLYVGDHLQEFSTYLKRAKKTTRKDKHKVQEHKPFLWLYDLHRELRPTLFCNVTTYEESLDRDENSYRAGLIFLTGHPTPEWLAAIGGVYDPDSFMMMDHMSFLPSASRPTYVLPSFPTKKGAVIRFTVPTIGHVETPLDPATSQELQRLRKTAARLDKASRQPVGNRAAGTPIIRRFYLHDTNCFSLEQDITVMFIQESDCWSLLAFCDSGADEDLHIVLSDCPEYEDRIFPLVPVIQESRNFDTSGDTPAERTSRLTTLSSLPAFYGKTLNRELASQDPFYALHELFEFVAQAELQFLNMMWQMVTSQVELQGEARIEVVGHERRGTPMLADFHHSRDALDQHLRRLRETVKLLRRREDLPLPMSSRHELGVIAQQAREDLLARFSFLVERAETLVGRCERGADLALNNAGLQLGERAFEYNRNVGKLTTVGTWIAVVFVPLSLVTSVFGMNFEQLGSGKQNIWIFAAIAVPILILSISALRWRKAMGFLEDVMESHHGEHQGNTSAH